MPSALEKTVALAYLRIEYAEPGSELEIGGIPARVRP